jgi:ABC-type siderophore export system fused ATPase/permease subunit
MTYAISIIAIAVAFGLLSVIAKKVIKDSDGSSVILAVGVVALCLFMIGSCLQEAEGKERSDEKVKIIDVGRDRPVLR